MALRAHSYALSINLLSSRNGATERRVVFLETTSKKGSWRSQCVWLSKRIVDVITCLRVAGSYTKSIGSFIRAASHVVGGSHGVMDTPCDTIWGSYGVSPFVAMDKKQADVRWWFVAVIIAINGPRSQQLCELGLRWPRHTKSASSCSCWRLSQRARPTVS